MAFSVGDRVSYNGRFGSVIRVKVLGTSNGILVEWEDGLSLPTIVQAGDMQSA